MTNEQETPDSDVPGCGRLLKRTRESLGLSVEDIGSELHLSSAQIDALEQDDWDRLPGVTYARGYVRSYARMLGLDAEALLAGATTQEIEISRKQPETENQQPAPETESTAGGSSKSRLPWAMVAGVIVIASIALYAWQLQLDSTSRTVVSTGEAESDGPERERDAGENAETELEADVADSKADSSVVVAEETEEGQTPVNGDAQNQPPTPTDPQRVVFQFDQSSWIDVRDAKGDRLLYRDFQAGRRVEIEGEPPFRVYLGNARGVQVEYLGGRVDPDMTSGRLYARFVLAPSG